jgi:predicted acylesterase/phospholipase RssA
MQKEIFLLLTALRHAVLSPADLRVCVEAFVPDIDITETTIPFAAVAADLNTGEQVVLSEGPIISAVMASCAVPGFMPPVHLDGRVLVDGGIVNTFMVNIKIGDSLLHRVVCVLGIMPVFIADRHTLRRHTVI